MTSVTECGWEGDEKGQRVTSLAVRLRQRTYVLPWSLFLYAEGDEGKVRATFHTHVVTVEGSGLEALLEAIAGQSVRQLVEPDRTAKFSAKPGPHVTTVAIAENK